MKQRRRNKGRQERRKCENLLRFTTFAVILKIALLQIFCLGHTHKTDSKKKNLFYCYVLFSLSPIPPPPPRSPLHQPHYFSGHLSAFIETCRNNFGTRRFAFNGPFFSKLLEMNKRIFNWVWLLKCAFRGSMQLSGSGNACSIERFTDLVFASI